MGSISDHSDGTLTDGIWWVIGTWSPRLGCRPLPPSSNGDGRPEFLALQKFGEEPENMHGWGLPSWAVFKIASWLMMGITMQIYATYWGWSQYIVGNPNLYLITSQEFWGFSAKQPILGVLVPCLTIDAGWLDVLWIFLDGSTCIHHPPPPPPLFLIIHHYPSSISAHPGTTI